MKTKKLLSLLTAAALSISSFAALTITANAADPTDGDVDDLTAIDSAYTFIAQDHITTYVDPDDNKTKPNTGIYDSKIYYDGNNKADNKGSSVINNKEYLNYAKVKGYNVALKVSTDATITVYGSGDINNKRRWAASYDKSVAAVYTDAGANTLTLDVDVNESTNEVKTVYIGGFNTDENTGGLSISGGDLYLAGIVVTPKTAPAPEKPGAVTLTGENVTNYGNDAASIWNGKITATGATYSTITATVTLNEPDENGKTEASNSGAAPTITTEGNVTVYVAVNKLVEDIKTVTLTVE